MPNNEKAKQVTKSLVFGGNGGETKEKETPETIELLNELTKQIFQSDNVETRTDLKENQLLKFAVARAYADRFDIPVIKSVLETYSIYAISKGRKSRDEFTKLASSITGYSVEAEGRAKSIPDNLLGRS